MGDRQGHVAPLDRARALNRVEYLIEGMNERQISRYADGNLGEPLGWQTEVNEIRRILEYLLAAIKDDPPTNPP